MRQAVRGLTATSVLWYLIRSIKNDVGANCSSPLLGGQLCPTWETAYNAPAGCYQQLLPGHASKGKVSPHRVTTGSLHCVRRFVRRCVI